jgi:hypothetical protein
VTPTPGSVGLRTIHEGTVRGLELCRLNSDPACRQKNVGQCTFPDSSNPAKKVFLSTASSEVPLSRTFPHIPTATTLPMPSPYSPSLSVLCDSTKESGISPAEKGILLTDKTTSAGHNEYVARQSPFLK